MLQESANYRVVRAINVFLTSFRAKILALVLISVIVPSGIIWVVTVRNTERFQTDQTKEKFESVLGNARKEIGYWYKDRLGDVERLVRANGFESPMERYLAASTASSRERYRNQIQKYFSFIIEKFPVYRRFVVIDRRGRLLVTTSVLDAETVEVLKSLQEQAVVNPFVSRAAVGDSGDAISQWIVIPLDPDGRTKGVTCVELDLTELNELLASDTITLAIDADLYLMDENGRFITQPHAMPFDSSSAPGAILDSRPPIEPDALEDEPALVIERYSRVVLADDGKKRRQNFLASKAYLSELGWWLVCEAEESEVIAPVVTRKNRILLANLLISALCLLGAWRLSSYLLKPLTDLSLGAKRINEGMVGVKIPGGGKDEVGHMIAAFNDMAERIALSEVELQAKNKLLQQKNVELTQVNDRLEQLSVTDGLTGLFNHRHFWNLMNTELTRVNLYRGDLGLVLLDVDDFKRVNDRFGHAVGDRLIQSIASMIRRTVRETDLIARYGGEEFAILLPDTSREGVLNVSEKARLAIEQMVFKVPDTDITLTVTVSIGVSVFRGDRREFFNAADRALYRSKSRGKNQVSFALAQS